LKQFKFHKLNTLTQAIPLAIAITLLFISYFKILDVEYSKLNKLCKVLAYAIIALHFTQTLWYKHYVSYNKKGITIRLNRNILQERTFQFKYLETISVINGVISFHYRQQPEEIDLSDFQEKDINKVFQLLTNSGNLI